MNHRKNYTVGQIFSVNHFVEMIEISQILRYLFPSLRLTTLLSIVLFLTTSFNKSITIEIYIMSTSSTNMSIILIID